MNSKDEKEYKSKLKQIRKLVEEAAHIKSSRMKIKGENNFHNETPFEVLAEVRNDFIDDYTSGMGEDDVLVPWRKSDKKNLKLLFEWMSENCDYDDVDSDYESLKGGDITYGRN